MLYVHAFLLLFTGASAAFPYVRSMTPAGVPLYRADVSNIQFLVNTSVRPGARNAAGNLAVTEDSDPSAALSAALGAWNAVPGSAVHFAGLQETGLEYRPGEGRNIVTIADTAETRSVVGSYLAVTMWVYRDDGEIVDSGIYLNPALTEGGTPVPFSTTRAAGTYDLQSIATHELGHTLGASHSGIVCSSMFQSTVKFSTWVTTAEATAQSTISADDAAFLLATYPASSGGPTYGRLAGSVRFEDGAPVRGALVVAMNPESGVMVGGLAAISDGAYTIGGLPAGRYLVYTQPLNGPVRPANLDVPGLAGADTSFRTTFAGGNGTPALFDVGEGTAVCDLTVDAEPSQMGITRIGIGSAGGTDWASAGTKGIESGRAWDVLIWGTNVPAGGVRLLGPGIAVRAGSERLQASAAVNGVVPLRLTVDVTAIDSRAPVALAVAEGTDAAVSSGALMILPAAVRN